MKKQFTIKQIVIFILALLAAACVTALAFNQLVRSAAGQPEQTQAIKKSPEKTEKQAETPEIEKAPEIQGPERPQELPKTVETYQQPSQSTPTTPVQSEPQQGGHVPFTNEPVTAGVPESYINTVGQCPFYEMAGEKGCVPPPDIECNADWSICKLKEGNQ